MSRFVVLFTVVMLAACSSETEPGSTLTSVPDRPNFDQHIRPIMQRYCLDCHGVPARQDAPNTFRLDRCRTTDRPGAQLLAASIVRRTLRSPSRPMPPRSYQPRNLTDIEKETLSLWLEVQAPCDPEDTERPEMPPYHPSGWRAQNDSATGDFHGPAAKLKRHSGADQLAPYRACNEATCHGEDLTGGQTGVGCDSCHDTATPTRDWRTDCTWCHGDRDDVTGLGSPPRYIDGSRQPERGEIHPAHVLPGELSAGYECSQCHLEPVDVLSPGHVFVADETEAVAEVVFDGGLAAGATAEFASFDNGRDVALTRCNDVYCHGNGRIAADIRPTQPVLCESCHPSQTSDPTRWRELSKPHAQHLSFDAEPIVCGDCHAEVVSRQAAEVDPTVLDIARHVDGSFDTAIAQPWRDEGLSLTEGRCSGTCHGFTHDGATW